MKKVLITLTTLLTLGMGAQVAAQKHRHTPQSELVDSTSKDAVEVYSDTTSTDTATATSSVTKHKGTVTVTYPTSPWSSNSTTYEVDDEDFGSMVHHVFSNMDAKDVTGMFFVLGVLLILFVLKQKMKLAQMAMQQGQPIPDQLLEDKPIDSDNEYQKGMRQCFVGVGLMIFLGYAAGQVGFGIGALVFCIGLGKVFASRTARRNNRDLYNNDNNNI